MALDGKLMAAAVDARNGVFEVGNVSALFGTLPTTRGFPYDVSADSQRFLTAAAPDGVGMPQPSIVRNWAAAFKK